MAAGSISGSEFTNQANIFFAMSVQNNDTWELKSSPQDKTEVYLSKRCYIEVAMETKESPSNESPQELCTSTNQEQEEDMENDSLEDVDAASLPSVMTGRSPCLFEYHIIYSASYAVPVLYFNAYTQGGSLLSLDTVWNNVPKHYQERLRNERWTVLTQQEHPILARPFFQLHPCHTADLMKQLDADTYNRNYLASWLSAVGPVVGLTLPLSYAKG